MSINRRALNQFGLLTTGQLIIKKAHSTAFRTVCTSAAAGMAVTRSSKTRTRKNHDADNDAKKTVSGKSDKQGPERTADGHYIIVNGRKWRATDPLIPEAELAELKSYLSKGRTGVRGMKSKGKTEQDEDIKLSRKTTGLAKLGLGERGKPEWWLDTKEGRHKRYGDALEQLRELRGDAAR
jgi:hypothetical protein